MITKASKLLTKELITPDKDALGNPHSRFKSLVPKNKKICKILRLMKLKIHAIPLSNSHINQAVRLDN